MQHVVDFCFLGGYNTPTLLVLHQKKETWAGRLPACRETVIATAFSLNWDLDSYPKIWSADPLPHDCVDIVTFQDPSVDGVLVLSNNAILYVNRGSVTCLPVNNFARESCPTLEPSPTGLNFVLAGSHSCFLTKREILLALKNGDWFLLRLDIEGGIVRQMHVHKVGTSVLSSCVRQCFPSNNHISSHFTSEYFFILLCNWGHHSVPRCGSPHSLQITRFHGRHIFVGSRLGDPVLVEYSRPGLEEELALLEQVEGNGEWEGLYLEEDEEDEEDVKPQANGPSLSEGKKEPAQCTEKTEEEELEELFGGVGASTGNVHLEVAGGKRSFSTEVTPSQAQTESPPNKRQKVSENRRESISFPEEVAPEEAVFIFDSSGTGTEFGVADEFSALFGPSTSSSAAIGGTSKEDAFSFRVVDSLLNVGPIADFCVSSSTRASSWSEETLSRKVLTTCSGYGKNGSLCRMERAVVVNTIAEVALQDCVGLWAPKWYHPEDSARMSGLCTHLVIALPRETKLLEAGEDILETETSKKVPISRKERTLGVSVIHDAEPCLLQVTPKGALLVDWDSVLDRFDVPDSAVVQSCTISDPFSVLLLDNGSTITLHVSREGGLVDVTNTLPEASGDTRATRTTAVTLFSSRKVPGMESVCFQARCLSDGSLEIIQLPGGELVFRVAEFSSGFTLLRSELTNENHSTVDSPLPVVHQLGAQFIGRSPFLMALLSNGDTLAYKAHLTSYQERRWEGRTSARMRHSCFVRQAVPFSTLFSSFGAPPAALSSDVRASTVSSTVKEAWASTSSRRAEFWDSEDPVESAPESGTDGLDDSCFQLQEMCSHDTVLPPALRCRPSWIVPFSGIGGHSGFFVCGPRPFWVFYDRGQLRFHPCASRHVFAFTSLNMSLCPGGFCFFSMEEGDMQVCMLPSDGTTVLSHWPTRKINLRCTPRKIAYHAKKDVVAVALSENRSRIRPLDNGGIELHESDPKTLPERDFLTPRTFDPHFFLCLYSPDSFVEMDRIEFGAEEEVSNLKVCQLKGDPDQFGKNREVKVPCVVVSTCYQQGEDMASAGRLLVFELFYDTNAEAELPDGRTPVRLKQIAEKPFNTPATALCQIGGHIFHSEGSHIYVHMMDWDSKTLVPAAFFDAQTYMTCAVSIKNYVLWGDMVKSAFLMRWTEEDQGEVISRLLPCIARTYDSQQVLTTEFAVQGTELYAVVSDHRHNLKVYQYQPWNSESYGGQRLVCVADFYTGSVVAASHRVILDRNHPRIGVLQSTSRGSVSLLLPALPASRRALNSVSARMVTSLPHNAGLNPKAFRLCRHPGKVPRIFKNILDMNFLSRFLALPIHKQAAIAEQIGMSREEVLCALVEVERSTGIV